MSLPTFHSQKEIVDYSLKSCIMNSKEFQIHLLKHNVKIQGDNFVQTELTFVNSNQSLRNTNLIYSYSFRREYFHNEKPVQKMILLQRGVTLSKLVTSEDCKTVPERYGRLHVCSINVSNDKEKWIQI